MTRPACGRCPCVGLDGVHGEIELLADLSLGEVGREQPQDLQLRRRGLLAGQTPGGIGPRLHEQGRSLGRQRRQAPRVLKLGEQVARLVQRLLGLAQHAASSRGSTRAGSTPRRGRRSPRGRRRIRSALLGLCSASLSFPSAASTTRLGRRMQSRPPSSVEDPFCRAIVLAAWRGGGQRRGDRALLRRVPVSTTPRCGPGSDRSASSCRTALCAISAASSSSPAK